MSNQDNDPTDAPSIHFLDKNLTLQSSAQFLEDPQMWLRQFMVNKSYLLLPKKMFYLSGKTFKLSEVLRHAKLEYDLEFKLTNGHRGRQRKLDRATSEILGLAFEKYVDDGWKTMLTVLTNKLRNRGTDSVDFLESFINACTGNINKTDVYVMAHWIWQVKRKLIGLPVSNHIMPIFIGKQGSGKSTAVEKITSVLESYRSDLSVTALSDERNFHALEEAYVVICDEMQGCDRVDIDRLKNIVTAKLVTARKLYTNIRDQIPQNCTFIGTSNKIIEELIRDESGIRRFYPIQCLDQMNWQSISQLPYTAIWQSIDENRKDGYLNEVIDDVRTKQEAHRVTSNIEEFFNDLKGIPINVGFSKTVSVDEVYKDYTDWCEKTGHKQMDRSWFSRNAKKLGVDTVRSNGVRSLIVSSEYLDIFRLVDNNSQTKNEST